MSSFFAKSIEIANKEIGHEKPVFIVAEIGINHNGDMSLAKQMIDAAARAQVDSVKFQNYNTEDFLSSDTTLEWEYENATNNTIVRESQYDMFKRCELSEVNVKELKDYCDSKGIIFHSTPTSKSGVDLLKRVGSPVLKNGSDFLTNSSLLKHMAKSGLPVVIATGMADEKEISEAVKTIQNAGNAKLIVLHCTSAYPTPPEHVNLLKLSTIANKFGCLTGLSDHSAGTQAAVGATALGACWIEKHFTTDKNLPGPDHRFSCDEAEMSSLVKAVRSMEILLGSGDLNPAECELIGRAQFRLSCASARDLRAGHILKEDDIIYRRPATGVSPSDLNLILGKSLVRDIPRFEPLKLEDVCEK